MKKISQYVYVVFAQNVHFGLVGKHRQDATLLHSKNMALLLKMSGAFVGKHRMLPAFHSEFIS
jgi:hypothetical protein